MKKTLIHSRYGQIRYIELVDQDKGLFAVHGKSAYTRHSDEMFDFDGGPCIEVGADFYGVGTVTHVSGRVPEGVSVALGDAACAYVTVDYSKDALECLKRLMPITIFSPETKKVKRPKTLRDHFDSFNAGTTI
jgi:hypothetical protein